MITKIECFLEKENLVRIQEWFAKTSWDEGTITSGSHASKVKHNLQISGDSPERRSVTNVIHTSIQKDRDFMMACFPNKASTPLYARYTEGMYYGNHVDNAVMADLRTDIAVTVFLSDPESYTGGDLVIEDSFGTHRIKLPAGSLVAYPASSLHSVSVIDRGIRDVAVFWIQSAVKNPAHRQILWDLYQIRRGLDAFNPDLPRLSDLGCVHQNLLRQWVDM
jgi:PKHD-type hydroxylase